LARFVIRHSSFVIRHSSFVIRHSSFVIGHSLLAILANVPGRLPEAVSHFEAALKITPDVIEA
jgi:hypothetical protein